MAVLRGTLPVATLVGRGEKLELEVTLPPADSVPPGYVYIPAGRFLFGTATDDTLRQSFLSTVPLHPRETSAYLISRYETTYREIGRASCRERVSSPV